MDNGRGGRGGGRTGPVTWLLVNLAVLSAVTLQVAYFEADSWQGTECDSQF